MEKITYEELTTLQNATTPCVKGAGFVSIDTKGDAIWLEFGTVYNKDWQDVCYYVMQKSFSRLDGKQQGRAEITLLTLTEFNEIILKGVKRK